MKVAIFIGAICAATVGFAYLVLISAATTYLFGRWAAGFLGWL